MYSRFPDASRHGTTYLDRSFLLVVFMMMRMKLILQDPKTIPVLYEPTDF
jgi:hypothetical protein